MTVGMHTATTTESRGTARLMIKGVPMAVDMRTTTIKGARGTVWTGRGRVHDDRHVRRHHQGGARRGEDVTNGEPMAVGAHRHHQKGGVGVRRGWAERMWEQLPQL